MRACHMVMLALPCDKINVEQECNYLCSVPALSLFKPKHLKNRKLYTMDLSNKLVSSAKKPSSL